LGDRILGKSEAIITFGWVWWRHQSQPFLILRRGPPTLNPPLATRSWDYGTIDWLNRKCTIHDTT